MAKINGEVLKAILDRANSLHTGSADRTESPNSIMDKPGLADAITMIRQDEEKASEILAEAVTKGYNPNLEIKNSQVKNDYYQGNSYSIKFNGLKVSIQNNSNGETHYMNLYRMLKGMNSDETIEFLLFIQKQPGEILEDLSIEMDNLQSPEGHNMHTVQGNSDFVAGGYYQSSEDIIVTSPKHLVHELGHAVDYSGNKNRAQSMNDPMFNTAFQRGLQAFKQAGNKQFDKEDKTTWQNQVPGNSNYCTTNPKEMFAECYTLAMTGNCNSKNVILTYFREAFDRAVELLRDQRDLADLDRRHTPERERQEWIHNTFTSNA